MTRFMKKRWALPFLALGVLAVAGCDDDDPVGPDEGTLTVMVTTMGAPADPDGFQLTVEGAAFGGAVPATGGTITDDLETGTYELELTGLAANCTVAANNPRDVVITTNQTTTETFAVTCAPQTGSIAVTTTTTGATPDPDGYEVVVGTNAPVTIGVNETVTIENVTSGDVDVLLDGIAANCTVTGGNPVTATVAANLVEPVTFAIDCPAPTVRVGATTATNREAS